MTKQNSRTIIAVIGLNALIIFIGWLVISALPAHTFSARLIAAGRLTGLIAAYCALIEIFLMSRLPSVERAFGLERLVKIHRWNGYLVFYSMLTHPILLSFGYQINGQPNPFIQFFRFITNYPDMVKALIGTILFIAVAGFSIAYARKRLGYELWYIIHLTAYLAVILAFSHQLSTGGDFLTHPVFRYYWIALLIATFALIAIYRFLSPVLMYFYTGARVHRVAAESSGVYSVYIRGHRFNKLGIHAGQYFGFQFLDSNLWAQMHPFTISKAHSDTELRITFQVYGGYTARLSKVKPGTPVLLDGPRGNSTWAISTRRKTIMIAGGIGITPMRALIESAPKNQDIVLLYACSNREKSPLLAELRTLPSRAKVNVIPIFSNERGRLSANLIDELVPDLADREAYLCGPDSLIKQLNLHLQTKGIPEKSIHTERFAY